MCSRFVAAVLVLLFALPAYAQSPATSNTHVEPDRERTSANAALDERQAHDWGLRVEEWERYRQLMQGPLGLHSPNLDPLTALGIEARTGEERTRYAELQVQVEAQRVGKILAYQRAYDAAWQRLHPDMPRIADGEVAGTRNAGSGRLAVFIKADCTPCVQRVRGLQATGTEFDLYMVGSRGDDARLREWATQAGIDPARVRARTITLNHDGGRWLSLQLSGDLPAVVREINGQWQRQ
jgi:integrating conjugative element protein (TIGR03759 family)